MDGIKGCQRTIWLWEHITNTSGEADVLCKFRSLNRQKSPSGMLLKPTSCEVFRSSQQRTVGAWNRWWQLDQTFIFLRMAQKWHIKCWKPCWMVSQLDQLCGPIGTPFLIHHLKCHHIAPPWKAGVRFSQGGKFSSAVAASHWRLLQDWVGGDAMGHVQTTGIGAIEPLEHQMTGEDCEM